MSEKEKGSAPTGPDTYFLCAMPPLGEQADWICDYCGQHRTRHGADMRCPGAAPKSPADLNVLRERVYSCAEKWAAEKTAVRAQDLGFAAIAYGQELCALYHHKHQAQTAGSGLPPWATGEFTQQFALYNMLMAWPAEECKAFFAMLSHRPDFNPDANKEEGTASAPLQRAGDGQIREAVERLEAEMRHARDMAEERDDNAGGHAYAHCLGAVREVLALLGEAPPKVEQSPVTPKFPVSQAPEGGAGT